MLFFLSSGFFFLILIGTILAISSSSKLSSLGSLSEPELPPPSPSSLPSVSFNSSLFSDSSF